MNLARIRRLQCDLAHNAAIFLRREAAAKSPSRQAGGGPGNRVDAAAGCGLGKRLGWVAERLKAPVLKTGRRESASWVRIPPHPPPFAFDAGYAAV